MPEFAYVTVPETAHPGPLPGKIQADGKYRVTWDGNVLEQQPGERKLYSAPIARHWCKKYPGAVMEDCDAPAELRPVGVPEAAPKFEYQGQSYGSQAEMIEAIKAQALAEAEKRYQRPETPPVTPQPPPQGQGQRPPHDQRR